jgi:putative intracellular protease/amidase
MKLFRRRLITLALAATVAVSLAPASGSASGWAPSSAVQTATRASGARHAELLSFLMEQVADPAQFEGKRIAILASDGASAFELETARDYFMDRGARVHILAPRPVERAPMVGLAGFVPPGELLTTLDYAGGRRLVAVTWYLDQVAVQDYDAVYVPNNLEDIGRLGANGQTIRFLVAAQGSRRPIFVTGNATAVIPGLEIPRATRMEGVPAMQARQWRVYAGEGAFDMPQLIGAIADTLAATPNREIN